MTKNQIKHPVQRTDRRRPSAARRPVAPAEYGGVQDVTEKGVTTVLLRQEIGDVLREVRLRQGRTLREVSSSARVSLGYLSEVERGQKEASSELLSAICNALNVPLSIVLREVADRVSLIEAVNQKPDGWEATVTILVILVVLMIASQFITQLQIISKNLSPEAKTGQAYQMQRIMLYILPLAFIFSGVFFPLGVVLYWFTSNIWTMVQQFIVIREMPTPGSEAAKQREERLARKGKAIDSSGKIVPMEKYLAEQQRLLEEAERAKAQAPKREQPMSKQRAKKQGQRPAGGANPRPQNPRPKGSATGGSSPSPESNK